jgi:hypothetical protein
MEPARAIPEKVENDFPSGIAAKTTIRSFQRLREAVKTIQAASRPQSAIRRPVR